MGYRCPVCNDPQADDVHLANHLAFTAMLRGGDHEAWLDDRVTDWEGLGDEELATRLTEYADETEYPQVFEDTADSAHDEGANTGDGRVPGGRTADSVAATPEIPAEELREIVEEAREITRKRRADDTDEESAQTDS
jgi:hypothetical protein